MTKKKLVKEEEKKEVVVTKENKPLYPKKQRELLVDYTFGDKLYRAGEKIELTDKAYEFYKSKYILK